MIYRTQDMIHLKHIGLILSLVRFRGLVNLLWEIWSIPRKTNLAECGLQNVYCPTKDLGRAEKFVKSTKLEKRLPGLSIYIELI